ncbi:glycoside hydrolase family 13 protein [Leuconostoc pseudomesenteroides]|uniref:glycoside hydrolase family 13 protein n=1 Tax=Leuconostoc pseudomesenteroides TaxID=33968 RepID=UPI00166F283A|nr:glycoside hydrolase family 13 protein [Leuconostoc pseudomesenteroides]
MNKAAIYHRPESEYAYLYTADELRLRIRTAKNDIQSISIVAGDPYNWQNVTWQKSANVVMKKTLVTETHQYWQASLTAPFNRLNYGFILTDSLGASVFYGDQGFEALTSSSNDDNSLMGANNYFKMPYFQEIDRFKAPEWVKKTVWYQIFPERFANGDTSNDPSGTLPWRSGDHPTAESFYGGDLKGIINHLDHFSQLGINGLYLTPIFKAPTNHKYDTQDYFEIDPHFGTKEDFKLLVERAHAAGIRVMLDAVFNHIGDQSPQWQDVIANSRQSKYADWFHIHDFPVRYTPTDNFEYTADANYDTFAFTPHMPKLNTANPEVQDYLIDIATYWIKEFDIDGWRLDVANEVDHHFWKKFRRATTAIKPDIYILGEIWTSAQSWLQGDEFSAVMNYAFTGSIVDFFAKQQISPSQMVHKLNAQLMLNRDQTNQVMFNLLDSHDAPRILTVAHNNKAIVKQMYTFMFLQQGTPDIYYGSEYAMSGQQDPDNRRPMVWQSDQQDATMYDFLKQLIQLRHDYQTVLSEGTLSWETDDNKNIVGFTRQLGQTKIFAIFNAGNTNYEIPTSIDISHIISEQLYNSHIIQPNGFLVTISNQ